MGEKMEGCPSIHQVDLASHLVSNGQNMLSQNIKLKDAACSILLRFLAADAKAANESYKSHHSYLQAAAPSPEETEHD